MAQGVMDRPWRVALREYAHTVPLLSGAVRPEGVPLDFVEVEPINRAFAPMVRELAFDVCELAIATVFQAVEAGVPIVALPVVLHGNHHHRSISVLDASRRVAPGDLAGRRVGVRSYSQTTGMWVRGVLSDTYGLDPASVTWVTREGPHVAQAIDPGNVEHADAPLVEMLRDGDLAAVVMGARSVDHVDALVPLLPDVDAQQKAYEQEHGWMPINHLAVVRRDLVEEHPEAVRAVYGALTRSIEAARPDVPRVIEYGPTHTMVDSLETALRYSREQGIIGRSMTVDELFTPFRELVDA